MAKSLLASFAPNTVNSPTGINQHWSLSGCFAANSLVSTANIAQCQLKIPAAGTLTSFTVVLNNNTRNGSTTFKLNVNGTDQGTGCVFGASTAGSQTDAGSVSVAAGDLVCVNCTQFAGSTGTMGIMQFTAVYEPTSGDVAQMSYNFLVNTLGSSGTLAANNVSPGIVNGVRSAAFVCPTAVASETIEYRNYCYAEGTYQNLRVVITANTLVGVSPVFELYKNGIATGLKVTITANNGAEVKEDTTHTVSVVQGDYLQYRCDLTGRSAGSITILLVNIQFVSNNSSFDFFGQCGYLDSGDSVGNNTLEHVSFGNPFQIGATIPSGVAIAIPFAARLDNFRLVHAADTATSTTFSLEKNGSAGNGTVTTATSGVTLSHDSTHHDDFAANDTLAYQFTAKTTAYTPMSTGVTITPLGVGTAGGSATVTGTGIQAKIGVGTTAGSASISGVGRSLNKQAATAAGSATVSGVGRSLVKGTGTAAGSATVSGDAHDVSSGAGSASGSATVSGVGRSLAKGIGTANAPGATVSGIGRSLFKGVGTTAGHATASAVGITAAIRSPSISASATVSGVGASGTGNFGLSAGRATVSGVGVAARIGVGTTAGQATVSGVGHELGKGVGTSGGSARVQGTGSSFLALKLDGSAHGVSNTASATATITTANAGDWIIAVVSFYTNSISETSWSAMPGANVSSPSIHEWGLRRRYEMNTGIGAGNILEVQVWAGYAPNALTSEVITASQINPNTMYMTLEVFGVQNADTLFPWDEGINSAAEHQAPDGSPDGNHNHTVSFTSDWPGFLFEHFAEQNGSGSTSLTVDSGWTALDQLSQSSSLYSHTAYKTPGSVLGSTSQNVWSNGTNTKDFIALVDGLRPVQPTWSGPKFVNAAAPTIYGGLGVSITSEAITLASNLVVGNILIAFISLTSTLTTACSSVTWPAGWNKIGSDFTQSGTTHGQTGSWAWRKIDGTEGPTVTPTWTTGSSAGMCQCMQFSNADTTGSGPVGDYHTNLSANGAASVTNTALTTTRNNSLAVTYLDYAESDPLAAPDHYTPRMMGTHATGGVFGSWHIMDEPIATTGGTADSPNMTAPAVSPWLQWHFELLAAPPGAQAGGHATVSGVGAAIKVSVGTAGGTASVVSGVGRSLFKATGTSGGFATMIARGGNAGQSAGHATVSGVGIRAGVGVGHAGGHATADGESPNAIGGMDLAETPDNASFNMQFYLADASLVQETQDIFSAYATQPRSGTMIVVERPDTFNGAAFTVGEDVSFALHERVDIFNGHGYTAFVGHISAHESADIFRATTAGATHSKPRRVFFST